MRHSLFPEIGQPKIELILENVNFDIIPEFLCKAQTAVRKHYNSIKRTLSKEQGCVINGPKRKRTET